MTADTSKQEQKNSLVGLISTDYPPLMTSAAVQMRDLALEMNKLGCRTIVIVPTANLSQDWIKETLEGVEVLRIRAPKTRDIGYVRRTLGECSLPFLMLIRIRKSPFARLPWDLVAWYSPTIFFGPLILYLKWVSGCRTYLILRDIFPEWTLDLGLMRKGLAYAFFKAVAKIQYTAADVIGVQTYSNLAYLANWARQPTRRVEVLHNWQTPAFDVGCTIDISSTHLAGRKIAVYIGNMGIAQGMDILIEIAEDLSDREDIGFLFVGRGSEVKRLKERVQKNRLQNVLFHNEIDSREMPGLLSQCFVGLLALDPRHKTHNIPGKFLTYLRAGLPVVARVNKGTDLMHLINEERVGLAIDSSTTEPFRTFIESLIGNPRDYSLISQNCSELAEALFSSTAAAQQIIKSSLGKVE